MITIIDYDAGTMKSVEKALVSLGAQVCVSRRAEDILMADQVVLPGVGNFGSAMEKLKEYGLIPVIRRVCEEGKPFLGICLGLQLLFEESEESPGVQGLGILPGKIFHFPRENGLKIPHMGWNSLHLQHEGRLFQGIPQDTYVYFVHSYYLQAQEEEMVKAAADYGVSVHASVEKGNVFACQFHPEKSGELGLKILENFARIGESKGGIG